MNYKDTEEYKLLQNSVKDFADKEIRPNIMKWDEDQYFPVELFKKMGKMGYLGIFVPNEYHGSGLNYQDYITILTEISKVCGSIGLGVAAHNSLCTGHIYYNANQAQKDKYLSKLSTGEYIGAWGLTESSTGSDSARMKTVAKKLDKKWIINGSKNFITHGISADIAVILARTGEIGDNRGISAFIIEKGTIGFRPGKKENKLGMRASETSELIFEDCEIPEENLIGNVGEGFIQAMKVLDGGRISIGALSLGIAKGAYEASLQYAKEREQFGKKISEFQAISFKLAEMATEIEASELLLRKAAYLKDNNLKDLTQISAMAKYYASESASRICNEAVQIFGGYGFTKDFPVEKFYRDVKLCTIGEGTTEIQKLVISRNILK